MQEKQFKVLAGGLLHDIGKLLYRYNDGRNHSVSGYDFLKEHASLEDEEILSQVKYHHFGMIKNSGLNNNSLAYITYIADNIAAAADRRKSNEQGTGFVREIAQDSIFNLLNNNTGKKKYTPGFLTQGINYPTDKSVKYSESFYGECINNIKNNVLGIEFTTHYINSLLEIIEANTTFVPSSTSTSEVADISLFDHSKLTAAIGVCIYQYLHEKGVDDYKHILFENAETFYNEKAFIIYSIDISGIQDFIYTVASDGALKALRTRSLYLELIMENFVDDILDKCGFARTNLIYCGGGHAYLLLSNTEKTKADIYEFETEANEWLLKMFKTALYISGGYAACSANDIKNQPAGSYRNIFKEISNNISEKKLNRYTAQQILNMNTQKHTDGSRECKVCHRTDMLKENGKCEICDGIEKFSKLAQNKDFFTVQTVKPEEAYLPLSKCRYIAADTRKSLELKIATKDGYVRSYSKNDMFTGDKLSTKIWMGDYQNGDDFSSFADAAEGIKRIAALRADIDNLGQAFVQGFENKNYTENYNTLSRTSTFSRKLALFFKYHINEILENGQYTFTDDTDHARKATIVYSGGDDVFVIGEWSDIISFAVDLHDNLKEFTDDTLTISAGIGIYPEKYPVATMARQTGELEEAAKSLPDKDGISLFSENNTYKWDEFINEVIEEKYWTIKDFFDNSEKFGKNFLYNLLELMRNTLEHPEEKINIARYAYLLGRMDPKGKAGTEREKEILNQQKENYLKFSKSMYKWIRDEKQCRQAITAIYIYVYTIRETAEQED